MKTVRDLPQMKSRVFEFVHEGAKVAWEWKPLTAEQVEAARIPFPAPKPPVRNLSDSAKELQGRQSKGLPLTYEDYNDPDYLAAVRKREDDIQIEIVRLALEWDMPREEFSAAMRSRVPYGVLQDLIRMVSAATFNLDFGEVERNLGSSSPSTGTGAASSTPTGP